MIQRELADCVGLDPTLASRMGPIISLSVVDGRMGPNVPGNGQGTPIPMMATPSPSGGNPSPPLDGNIQGTPQRPWVPKKKNWVCSFWRAGKCLKGESCEWLHQEPVGAPQDGGGPNPGAGVDNPNERNNNPDAPLCRWAKQGNMLYDVESGCCRKSTRFQIRTTLGREPRVLVIPL